MAREKADIWKAGHRIPFRARWPGHILPGAVSNEVGCLSDFTATAAAITGFPLPDNAAEGGYHLLPALLKQNKGPIRPDIIHQSINGMFSLRRGTGSWRTGWGQLYDLGADPAELNNLYQKRPEIVDSLATLLNRYKQLGHTRPLSGNR